MSAEQVLRHGWPPDNPVLQPPNASLTATAVTGIAAQLLDGRARDVALGAHLAAAAWWSLDELFDGVNVVRRLYGAAGLAYVAGRLTAAVR